ncbi:MAG: MATE family efflux transporter [Eubacteriales bacterium]
MCRGVEALAGVGSTGSINFMIVGFCTGIGTGFAIPVAQSFGVKNYSSMRKFIANTLWLSIVLVSLVTVLVSFFCRDILVLMKTPDDIIDYAYNYIFIIFVGLPIMYTYNLLAAIIRALGDSKSPVIFLIISAVINIVLDIISVGVFDMGVRGPAYATIISQAISVALCRIYRVVREPIAEMSSAFESLCFCRYSIINRVKYANLYLCEHTLYKGCFSSAFICVASGEAQLRKHLKTFCLFYHKQMKIAIIKC